MLPWNDDPVSDGSSAPGSIVKVLRTTWQTGLQDLLRRYTVFIDGEVVGRLWAFQSGEYAVTPGEHAVRLAIVNTGTSSSEEIKIIASHESIQVIRTVKRGGLLSALALPLAIPDAVQARSTGKPIHSRFYKTPWIHVSVTSEPSKV